MGGILSVPFRVFRGLSSDFPDRVPKLYFLVVKAGVFNAEAQSKRARSAEEVPVFSSAALSSSLCASALKWDLRPTLLHSL